jgi:acyl carrier protein
MSTSAFASSNHHKEYRDMDYQEYVAQLPEILELTTALTGEEALEEIEDWDSLRLLSFIAFADREFGRQPKITELKKCRTVRDLYGLLVD